MTATAVRTPARSIRSTGSVNPWLVLVIACLAQFMVVLDATVVNIALPSVQRGLHFTPPTSSGSSTATRSSSVASCCSAAAPLT